MLIKTENEIINLMPTSRWDRPEQLFGYLEEEERVALEPLLGTELYLWVCQQYEELIDLYGDITANTITPLKKAKEDPSLPYVDVTERLDNIHRGNLQYAISPSSSEGTIDVPEDDMQTIRLIRICQQIEFYKMLSHKAGLLTVSFNEGGGMNVITADGYDPAEEKRMDRVVKDAFMSAGRAIDTLLLFLEADAKGDRLFTEKWQKADAYYLHKDLLFQTAKVLNEYLDIKGERMAYVQLVRDIRFCQNTYLKPRVGVRLLKAMTAFANDGTLPELEAEDGVVPSRSQESEEDCRDVMNELLSLLRTALAFYTEGRRTELAPAREKLARRDSTMDAQQAMAAACDYIAANLDILGQAVTDTPIYTSVREKEREQERASTNVCRMEQRRRMEAQKQHSKKLFTGFPATHRGPDYR